MRVPDKPEIKIKETEFSPVFSVLLFASLVLSVLFYSMSPVFAEDNEKRLSITLINGDEIFVRSGSYYNFSQDYQLYVKGADSDGKRVWLELHRESVSLKDDIATEGTQFVYSHDSTEILNLTVRTIYTGADGVLVRFSPVYQYLDPKLPMPQTSKESPPIISNNGSFGRHGFETQAQVYNMPLFILGLGAIFLVTGYFARKGKKT